MAPMRNPEPADWPAWVRLGAIVAARAVLATIAGLLVWAVAPAVLGWQPTTVMTGSMQPRLMVGDIAVSRAAQEHDLRIDQVLLFDDPDHPGRLRLHRLVGVDPNGLLVTRGDANPAADSSHIRSKAVHGIATLRVPIIGWPLVWMRNSDWPKTGSVLTGLGLVLWLAAMSPLRGDRPSARRRSSAAQPRRASGPTTRRGRRRAATAVVTGCVALAVVVAVGTGAGWSAYADSTASAAQWAASDSYQTSAARSTLTVNDTADTTGWYIRASVSVTVTATASSGSRVASVSYQLGSEPVSTVNGTSANFTVATQGTTIVRYWATDGRGIAEDANTTQIRLDHAKPNLSIANPSSSSPSTAAWLQACSKDFSNGGICGQTDDGTGIGVATVRYTLQDSKGHYWKGTGAFTGNPNTLTADLDSSGHWSSPIPASVLTRGASYTLTVTGIDQLGNSTTIMIVFNLT